MVEENSIYENLGQQIDPQKTHGVAQNQEEELKAQEVFGAALRPKSVARQDVLKVDELPDGFKKKFLVSDEAPGKFMYHDRNNALAFEDQGSKLRTKEEDPQVIKSMVEVAKAKGWSSIRLAGSKEFKREAWLQASLNGLAIEGYAPTQEDKARLDALNKESMKNALEKADVNAVERVGVKVDQNDKNATLDPEIKDIPNQSKDKPRYSKEAIALGSLAAKQGVGKEKIDKYLLPAYAEAILAMKRAGLDIPKITLYDNKAPSRIRGQQIKQVSIEREKDIEQPKPSPKR